MAGWHYWPYGHESEWTPGAGDGQGGLACCDSWSCKALDMTDRLNWTELNLALLDNQRVQRASLVVLVVKSLPANAEYTGDAGLIPGLGRSPGWGHDNPLQYSVLENAMGRGACWATVCRVTKSQAQLKRLSMHTCMQNEQIKTSYRILPCTGFCLNSANVNLFVCLFVLAQQL